MWGKPALVPTGQATALFGAGVLGESGSQLCLFLRDQGLVVPAPESPSPLYITSHVFNTDLTHSGT